MIDKIKGLFSSYTNMTHAVNYLANHISYHFNNSRDTEFVKFNKAQLRFMVIARWKLSKKQIDKVIRLACNNVVSDAKSNFMVTKCSIYLAAY